MLAVAVCLPFIGCEKTYTFVNKSSFTVNILPEYGDNFQIQPKTAKNFGTKHSDMIFNYNPVDSVELKMTRANYFELYDKDVHDESAGFTIDGVYFATPDKYTANHSLSIQEYVKLFTELSPEILDRSNEVESIECQLLAISEDDDFYTILGWTAVIQVEIKIKDITNFPEDWDVNGKTLSYYLGGGRIPGIYLPTRQEHLFSGFINEKIGVITDIAFGGIDANFRSSIIKKQTPLVTATKFRNSFQEQFSKFGGRTLNEWAGTEMLYVEENLRLYFMNVGDDDSLRYVVLSYDDTTEGLEYDENYFIAYCAIISIFEPYLDVEQVKQFSKTLAEAFTITKTRLVLFWMPSGNVYDLRIDNNSISMTFRWRMWE
jgi:hypothetical protein